MKIEITTRDIEDSEFGEFKIKVDNAILRSLYKKDEAESEILKKIGSALINSKTFHSNDIQSK